MSEREESDAESDGESSGLIAGRHFPWEQIAGFFLRLDSFAPFTEIQGDKVGRPTLGAYALAGVELPNPDIDRVQRLFTLPIEHESDYKSMYRAHLDAGVRDRTTEVIVVYEHRRGMFGGKRPCLHVAAYPVGTWKNFFDAVSRYASQDFRWPPALFLYQPSDKSVFPANKNLFAN